MRFAAAAIVLLLLIAGRAGAQTPGLGASVELVDPKTFRVCADPRNLPFSNEAGEGFENKLAELFARKLTTKDFPTAAKLARGRRHC